MRMCVNVGRNGRSEKIKINANPLPGSFPNGLFLIGSGDRNGSIAKSRLSEKIIIINIIVIVTIVKITTAKTSTSKVSASVAILMTFRTTTKLAWRNRVTSVQRPRERLEINCFYKILPAGGKQEFQHQGGNIKFLLMVELRNSNRLKNITNYSL